MGDGQVARARPRVIETPDGATARLTGWKEIAAALGPDVSVPMARRASRRRVDPLRVRYDPFDRPWIYRSRLEAWLADNDRSARSYDAEKRAAEMGEAG